MKVTPVTAPAEASDPAHPEHDRWVKDVTLAREMEWAKTVGLPTRVAEAENARLLELTAKQAKDAPPPAPKQNKKQPAETGRTDSRGVTRRVAAPAAAEPKGCICGRCLDCKRNMRVMAIIERKRAGDVSALAYWNELTSTSLAAAAGVGRFKGLRKADIRRAMLATIDSICDRSVSLMGAWR